MEMKKTQSLNLIETVGTVRKRLEDRLSNFRPTPRTYLTAFCVGATIGEFAALMGKPTPESILLAIGSLGAQLGVNLIADIIGDKEPTKSLTEAEVVDIVQRAMEQGKDLPGVRTLLMEFNIIELAIQTWQESNQALLNRLIDELSSHPLVIAEDVSEKVVSALDSKFRSIDERLQEISQILHAQHRKKQFDRQLVGGPLLIFISSKMGEFEKIREQIQDYMQNEAVLMPWVFEHAVASTRDISQSYLQRVRECDIFILIVGKDISPAVETELYVARQSDKPILAFIRKEEGSVSVQRFITRIEQAGEFKYRLFDQDVDIAELVVEAVVQEIADRYRDFWKAVRNGYLPPPNMEQLVHAYAVEISNHQLFASWAKRYVPLSGTNEIKQSYTTINRSQEKQKEHEYSDVRDIVKRHPAIVLVGEPGSGKTTTLQRIGLDYAIEIQTGQDQYMPIYCSLGRYPFASTLQEHIAYSLQTAVVETPNGILPAHAHHRLAEHLDHFIKSGRIIFLLDGINEIRHREKSQTLEQLRNFVRLARSFGCIVVLATRAENYGDIAQWIEIEKVTIKELEFPIIRRFLLHHLGSMANPLVDKIKSDKNLDDLARNPYRLWMLQAIYSQYGEIPENRALLYQRILDWLLDRQEKLSTHVNPEGWFDKDVILTVLAKLAYELFSSADTYTSAPLGWVYDHLEGTVYIKGVRKRYDSDRLLDLARSAGITHQTDAVLEDGQSVSVFRFSHQVLQEYLAAVYFDFLGISHRNTQLCLTQDSWDEVIILLSCLSLNVTQIVNYLLPLNPILAARCAGNVPERIDPVVEVKLIEKLKTLIYSSSSPWVSQAILALGQSRQKKALPVLSNLLYNERSGISGDVKKALGLLKMQDAAPFLAQLLQDPLKNTLMVSSKEAVDALVAIGSLEYLPLLLEILQKDESGNPFGDFEAAVEGVGIFKAREAIPLLTAHLKKGQASINRSAAIALSNIDPDYTHQLLETMLSDPEADVRRAAVWGIHALDAFDDIPGVLYRLKDEDYSVRLAAIRGLADHKQRSFVPNLLDLIRPETTDNERTHIGLLSGICVADDEQEIAFILLMTIYGEIIDILVKYDVREAIPLLIENIQDEYCLNVAKAVEALGTFKAREAIPTIIRLLLYSDWSEFTRFMGLATVINNLADLWKLEDLSDLVELLESPHPYLAIAAASGIGRLKYVEAIPTLERLAQNSRVDVQRAAINALGMIGSQDAIAVLEKFLHRPNPDIRIAALEALEKAPNAAQSTQILEMLNDPVWQVRRAASSTAAKLKMHAAIPTLISWLSDPDSSIRYEAVWSIGEIGAKEALSALIYRLTDGEEFIRKVTYESLEKIKSEEGAPAFIISYVHRNNLERYIPSFEIVPPLARVLLETITEDRLEDIQQLLMYPNSTVQRNIYFLYESARRKIKGVRDSQAYNFTNQNFSMVIVKPFDLLPERAAMWKTVLLARSAYQFSPGWELGVRTIVDGLCRLGCSDAAVAFLDGQDDKLRLDPELSLYKLEVRSDDDIRRLLDNYSDFANWDILSLIYYVNSCIAVDNLAAAETALHQRDTIFLSEESIYQTRFEKLYLNILQNKLASVESDITSWAFSLSHMNVISLKGVLALTKGEFNLAVQNLTEVVQYEFSPEWLYLLAFAHIGTGEQDKGIQIFHDALEKTALREQFVKPLRIYRLCNFDFVDADSRPLNALMLERINELNQIADDERKQYWEINRV